MEAGGRLQETVVLGGTLWRVLAPWLRRTRVERWCQKRLGGAVFLGFKVVVFGVKGFPDELTVVFNSGQQRAGWLVK